MANTNKPPPPTSHQITIKTPRLILRGAQLSDAEDLHEVFTDAEVMRYWSTLPHTNLERTNKWIDSMMKGSRNGVKDFVICLKPAATTTSPDSNLTNSAYTPSMKVIGKIGMWHASEIGFLLHRSYWRKGFATEAVKAVLDKWYSVDGDAGGNVDAEDNDTTADSKVDDDDDDDEEDDTADAGNETNPFQRPASDVVADVDPRNEASKGILKKLGFIEYAYQERTAQVGDEWVDTTWLYINREMWMKRRKELFLE